ncbi:MAG: hypothetical protein KDC24_10755, partial [Saprospiraceae bacterium]|nr:hypothetical protein [Saprospiraceae bacterium]
SSYTHSPNGHRINKNGTLEFNNTRKSTGRLGIGSRGTVAGGRLILDINFIEELWILIWEKS